MIFFVRAVVTGFGLSLGSAIFKKHVAPRLGLEDEKADDKTKKREREEQEQGGDPDLDGQPGLGA